MIQEVAEILAEKVKMTPAELMSLSVPEKLNDLKEKLKDGTFYSKADRDQLMGNFRTSLKGDNSFKEELMKDQNFRNSLHPMLKGEILESHEQSVLKEHGLEWKRGVDYADALDLNKKLLAKKEAEWKKASPKDKDAIAKEIEELQTKVLGKDKEFTDYKSASETKITNTHLNYAFSAIENALDFEKEQVLGQLEFLKFKWKQDGYTVNIDDNGDITEVLQKGAVVKGEDFKPIPLATVVEQLAAKYSKLKKGSNVKGWGGAPDVQTDGSDYKKFKSFEDLQAWYKKQNGKDLVLGSKEANEEYGKWQKAQAA